MKKINLPDLIDDEIDNLQSINDIYQLLSRYHLILNDEFYIKINKICNKFNDPEYVLYNIKKYYLTLLENVLVSGDSYSRIVIGIYHILLHPLFNSKGILNPRFSKKFKDYNINMDFIKSIIEINNNSDIFVYIDTYLFNSRSTLKEIVTVNDMGMIHKYDKNYNLVSIKFPDGKELKTNQNKKRSKYDIF